MSEPQFGRLITDGQQTRDAIHIATTSATAAEMLLPGQRVGRTDPANDLVDSHSDPVGIVDPYLAAPVMKGQRFWLFLFPGTITGLRHVWRHPAFPDQAPGPAPGEPAEATRRGEAVRWLTEFGKEHGLTCDGLIELGREARDEAGGEGDNAWYSFFVGNKEDLGYELRENAAEFWRNWSIATGIPMPGDAGERTSYHCSC